MSKPENTDPLSPDFNPPIFKHLHARDRSILKEGARIRAEKEKEEQEKAANMSSSEQTCVLISVERLLQEL